MKTAPLLGLALVSALIGVPAAAQDRPLTRAKQLYEAASYSEALAVLKQESSEDDVVEAETYRALCFLALGQPREAERAFEQLVLAKPFATLDSATVSPRVVSIFNDVRTKTIPAAAKDIYQKARASFDQGDFEHAATQFQQVITLAESAPPERAEMMSELKMLATGFVRLAENSRKPPETAPAVAAVASQTPAATAAPPPVAPAPAPAASTPPPPATSTPPAARAAPHGRRQAVRDRRPHIRLVERRRDSAGGPQALRARMAGQLDYCLEGKLQGRARGHRRRKWCGPRDAPVGCRASGV